MWSFHVYNLPFQCTIAIAAAVEELPDVHGINDQQTGVLLFFIRLFF